MKQQIHAFLGSDCYSQVDSMLTKALCSSLRIIHRDGSRVEDHSDISCLGIEQFFSFDMFLELPHTPRARKLASRMDKVANATCEIQYQGAYILKQPIAREAHILILRYISSILQQ